LETEARRGVNKRGQRIYMRLLSRLLVSRRSCLPVRTSAAVSSHWR